MIDSKKLWEEVKENYRKLDSCERHKFNPDDYIKGKLGQKMTCTKCGGVMNIVPDITSYINGYEASGRSADDIWKGFRDEH